MSSFNCWGIELMGGFSDLLLVMHQRALVKGVGLPSHTLPPLSITCRWMLQMDVLLAIDQQRWRTGPSYLCGVLFFFLTSS